MKKLFAVILAIVLVIALAACGQDKPEEVAASTTPAGDTYVINGEEQTIYPCYAIEENYVTDMVSMGYLEFEIYQPDEITPKMLHDRAEHHRVIVERLIGIVTSKDGDGKILNTSDTEHDYISYKDISLNYNVGTVMLTYLLYNPDTSYEDDILERYDYILDDRFEER